MKKKTDLRFLALESLLEIEKTQKKSGDIINAVLEKYRFLPRNERSFYKRLTEGTIEERIRLDHIIGCYSKTPLRKMKPVIRNILRLSVYQIKMMDSVPERAAVNEAVKLAGRKGFDSLAGFVNGVLRNVIRRPELLTWPDKNDTVRYISVMYSMPEYLVGKWIGSYGAEKTEEICSWFLNKKKLTVRLRCDADKKDRLLNEMKESGIIAEKAPLLENAYYLSGFDTVDLIPGFESGDLIIQDLSSMLAVKAAGIRKGDTVADVCAAPGGKSVYAADLTGNEGVVHARDISEHKILRIKANAERCGLKNIDIKTADAAVFDESLKECADVVIVDAPCSGYGVIGHKPDIKYRASAEKEASLKELQMKILKTASGYVKPGGTLMYSTCTVCRAENEDNAETFLRESGFEPKDLRSVFGTEFFGNVSSTGNHCFQILPGQFGCDGFFISCFKRPL